MKAMILCAGLGTRLRPITEKLAKPTVRFLNVPLMGFSLYHLEQLGLERLVVNTHHLPETVQSALRWLTEVRAISADAPSKDSYHVDITLEQPEILSSGGGIWHARNSLGFNVAPSSSDESFVVANGDEVILFPHNGGLQAFWEHHCRHKPLATFLTTHHPDVGVRLNGIRTDAEGRVTEISVKEAGLQHFAGIFAFSPDVWPLLKSASERVGPSFHIFKDVLIPALKEGARILTYFERDLLWLETSDCESLLHSAERALASLVKVDNYTENLRRILARFNLADKISDQWCAPALLGPEAKIGRDVKINGFAIFGPGASIESGTVEESIVGADVKLGREVHLRRQIVV